MNTNIETYFEACADVLIPDDFCGIFTELHPNGSLKFKGEFLKNGVPDGVHLNYHENGLPKQVTVWRSGKIYGAQSNFSESGSLERLRVYPFVAEKKAKFYEINLREDGSIKSAELWGCGRLVSWWMDPVIADALSKAGCNPYPSDVERKPLSYFEGCLADWDTERSKGG